MHHWLRGMDAPVFKIWQTAISHNQDKCIHIEDKYIGDGCVEDLMDGLLDALQNGPQNG